MNFSPKAKLRPATLALLARHRKLQETQALQPCLPGLDWAPSLLSTAITDESFVVLDTETTGLGAARLVEFAAVRVQAGHIVGQFQSFVQPECKIPKHVVAVHGITDAMVVGAPTAKELLPEVFAWVKDTVVWAHNASFDRGIFGHECARTGLAPPGWQWFCTMKLARKAFPALPRHGLGALTKSLGLQNMPAHRALADVFTAVELLGRCRAVLPPSLRLVDVHGPAKTL